MRRHTHTHRQTDTYHSRRRVWRPPSPSDRRVEHEPQSRRHASMLLLNWKIQQHQIRLWLSLIKWIVEWRMNGGPKTKDRLLDGMFDSSMEWVSHGWTNVVTHHGNTVSSCTHTHIRITIVTVSTFHPQSLTICVRFEQKKFALK